MDEQEYERDPSAEERDRAKRQRTLGIWLSILLCIAFLVAIVWVTMSNLDKTGASEPGTVTQTTTGGVTRPTGQGT